MGSEGYEPTGRRISSSTNPQRVIESSKSRSVAFDMGDSVESSAGFGSGLLAFIQSVLFGFALVVVPILVTAVSSTTLIDQDFNFGASFSTAAGIWALAHGASVTISGSLVSIVPLGITLVLVVSAYVSVRRSLMFDIKGVVAYVASYLLFGILLGVVTSSNLDLTLRSTLTSLGIAVVSVALARRKRSDSTPFFAYLTSHTSWLPRWAGVSGLASLIACALLTALAGITTLAWIYLGKDAMFTVLQGWSLDALSGAALGIAQLAFLPNLMLWALGWLSGAGFVIGDGTLISPSEVTLGPLPNLPLLGAIPQSEAPSSFGYVLLALVVLVGVVMAMRLARTDQDFTWWMFFAVPAVSVLSTSVFLALMLWLSSGEIGAGATMWFGVPMWSCVWRVGALLLVPAIITFTLLRDETRSWIQSKRSKSDHVYTEQLSEPQSVPPSSVAVPPFAVKSSGSARSTVPAARQDSVDKEADTAGRSSAGSSTSSGSPN